MAKQTVDAGKQLKHLEAKHRMLKERVSVLDRRAILTPKEQLEATALKKQKLATKDEINRLRTIN